MTFKTAQDLQVWIRITVKLGHEVIGLGESVNRKSCQAGSVRWKLLTSTMPTSITPPSARAEQQWWPYVHFFLFCFVFVFFVEFVKGLVGLLKVNRLLVTRRRPFELTTSIDIESPFVGPCQQLIMKDFERVSSINIGELHHLPPF